MTVVQPGRTPDLIEADHLDTFAPRQVVVPWRNRGPYMTGMIISNRNTSVRMFRSGLLEACSRVHPAVPHIIYVPVIGLALFAGYRRGVDSLSGVMLFATGLLAWTLAEYVIHRFVFHVPDILEERTLQAVRNVVPGEPVMPTLGWRERAYFVMHGVHHFFPNDSRRLVMPPSLSVPLAFFFYLGFLVLLGGDLTPVFFAGFVTGYLIYDTTHYVVHHKRCRGKWSAYVKKLHMRHHYLNPDRDFGVSSPLWDFAIGSRGKAQKLQSR